MKVVGLDLSLTATGIADANSCHTIRSKQKGMARLHEIRAVILDWCEQADLVVIEGYSFNSRNSQSHAAGELGGLIRYALWMRDTPYAEVPPATLKKYATGKGNADKDAMLIAALKHREVANNNEADAFWLWAMGVVLSQDRSILAAYKQDALGKVNWPDTLKETA